MQVELHCPHCSCDFVTPSDASVAKALERMSNQGPWYALGDGETFEDRISAALTTEGADLCPGCGAAVAISEESVVELAQELLAQW